MEPFKHLKDRLEQFIDINAFDSGNGQITIGYTITPGTTTPVAFALNVTLSNGATITGPGDDHPLTGINYPGEQNFPFSSLALCFGTLSATPASMDNLITLQLYDGGSGFTDATIELNQLRGGIINVNGIAFEANFSRTSTYPCPRPPNPIPARPRRHHSHQTQALSSTNMTPTSKIYFSISNQPLIEGQFAQEYIRTFYL